MSKKNSSKTLVIVNPKSAAGRAKRLWPRISRILAGRYGQFETRFTSRPQEATTLTREALQEENFEVVIAFGGDGTLNEVANGFFETPSPDTPLVPIRPEAKLGLFPFGTGGDFRKTLQIPKQPGQASSALREGVPHPIDVGRLDFYDTHGQKQSKIFINIASFGLSGLVDKYVDKGPKWLGGKSAFFFASAVGIALYTPQPVSLTLDGNEIFEGPIYLVAVSNGQYFGGGMWIAPDAKPDDGLFDIVIVRGMPKSRWVLKGSSVYNGKHLSLPEVSVHRGKKLVASSLGSSKVRIDMDGELPGNLDATFEVFPKALQFLAPK